MSYQLRCPKSKYFNREMLEIITLVTLTFSLAFFFGINILIAFSFFSFFLQQFMFTVLLVFVVILCSERMSRLLISSTADMPNTYTHTCMYIWNMYHFLVS